MTGTLVRLVITVVITSVAITIVTIILVLTSSSSSPLHDRRHRLASPYRHHHLATFIIAIICHLSLSASFSRSHFNNIREFVVCVVLVSLIMASRGGLASAGPAPGVQSIGGATIGVAPSVTTARMSAVALLASLPRGSVAGPAAGAARTDSAPAPSEGAAEAGPRAPGAKPNKWRLKKLESNKKTV